MDFLNSVFMLVLLFVASYISVGFFSLLFKLLKPANTPEYDNMKNGEDLIVYR
ncbi:MAG TPA: hypothetical protein VH186_21525 [Chloroflexia bacterium]|nr:hypothetical protein [Chloroflexia bacterium]